MRPMEEIRSLYYLRFMVIDRPGVLAQIAGELGMSPRTVNQHVDNVADKLGTRNRAHTVAEIVKRGLL